MKLYILIQILLFTAFSKCFCQLDEKWKSGIMQIKNNVDSSEGYGFLIGSRGDSFYVITAKHVVKREDEGAKQITVQNQQGQTYAATVLRFHENEDVALIGFKEEGRSPAKYCYVQDADVQLEVYFFKTKYDLILPRDIPGLIRKTDAEKRKFIVDIKGVEEGDSGSPLFCRSGLVAMIITNGMVKAVNIMRIKEIVTEEWQMKEIWKLCSVAGY